MFGGTGAFGSAGGAFGQQQQPGQQPGQQPAQQSLFGQPAGGGFGGFGQQQQQQPLFGQPASAAPAFGASTTTPFGAAASSTGFGAAANTAFGIQARPAFGSTGAGLFGGGSNATPSTGGFGAALTTPAFGAGAPSGGLFGAKPATTTFGFGAGATGQPSFGGTTTATGFGAPTSSGQSLPLQGTATQPFQPYTEKEGNTLTSQTLSFQSISAMQLYRNWSFEELRLLDYQQGRKTANTTGGFGQTQGFGTPAFGSNVSQPGPFGTTSAPATTSTNLFGQNQTGTQGAFGSTAFGSTTAPAFGTSSAGGFATKPAGTGLFGQTTTPAFGTSQPAPAFGSTAIAPTPFGAGFGTSANPAFGAAAQKPAFGFGTSTPAASAFAPTSAPSLFGQSATAPAFGTSQPAPTGFAVTSAPFGGFGSTAQSSTATAFNAKPATSGFSFGGSLGTEAKPPAFGFGQTTAQPAPTASTGLFGSTSTTTTPLFSGTTQPSTGLFAPTTSSTSAFGTGLFAPKPAGTASTPAPFTLGQTSSTSGTGFGGFTGLGGPSTLGVSTAQSTGPPLQASLNENAYGSSPLFTSPQKDKPASGLATSVGPLAVPTRPAAATPLASSVYRPARSTYKKPSPMSAARTKQLRFASSFGGSPSPSPSAKPSTHLFDGKPDGELLSTSMLVPRRSIKKLVITPRNGSAAAAGEREGHENGIDPSLEAEAEEGNLSVSSSVYGRTPNKADRLTPGPTPGSAQSHASEVSPPKSFERGKYWTSPTISSLQKKPAGQLKSVKDFQVGRYGFGQIRFVDPVDLTEVTEGLDAIPGRIVQIFDRHCMVYADDENKPALGHGLNVPAVVSLENCYFIDKATREPIRDFNDRRYIRHLNRLKREQDTEFIDFLSETGTWVFRVEHFSRYGLFDDDDEDDEEGEEGDQDLRRSLREGTFAPERPAAQQAASIPRRPFELLPNALNPEDTFMGLRKARAVEPANVKPAYSAATRQESVMDTEDKRGGLLERVEGDANMLMTDEGASGDEDLASFPGGSQMAAAANSDDEVTSYSDGNVDSQEDFRVASREGAIPVRELPESTRPFGTLRPLAHSIGLDPREVQVRQASLFARLSPGRGKVLEKEMFGTAVIEHIEMLDDFNRVSHEQFPQGYKRPKSPTDSEASDDMDVDARVPNTFFQAPPARRIRKQPRIQYSRSVLYGKSCEVADAGLMMNRLFRVGWGPGGQIVHCGRLCGWKDLFNEGEDEEEPNNEEGSAYACITMEKVSVFKSFQEEVQKQRHVISLKTQMESCEIIATFDKVPSVKTLGNMPFCPLTDMVKKAPGEVFTEAERLFWKLGCALWDPIEWVPEFEQLQPPERQRVNSLKRKDMVVRWLQEAVHTASVRDANEALTRGEDPVASRAFALLSGHLVEEACLVLVKGGDRHLANLVAQAGQDSAVCQLIADQLARWNKLKVSEHMPRETLRVLSLLSGNTRRAVVDGEKGKQEFLVGEGLDWKRAFGLELWYGQYRHDGVRECVLEFDSSWTDSVSAAPALRVAPPVPWYVEEAGTNNLDGPAVVRMPRDAPWELLQLYSQPERPLDLVCQPAGFSSDLMDYRMPWLLYTKLSGSLAVREFMDVESEHGSRLAEYITASLSFQLENLGLWHWAVFVSLHHVQPDMREKAVRELIFRNVPACNEDQSEEWQERVRFLRETLHIPASWLYEAKALRARYEGDVREETLALLAAGRHAAAHMRIVMILAPEMIMKGSFDELVQLLKAVDPQEVPNWQAEGKMYLNYVEVVDKVPKVVARGAEPADVLEMKERLQLLLKLVSDAMGAKRSEGYPFASVQFDLRRNVALADMAANLSNSLQDLESLVQTKDIVEQNDECLNRISLPVDQRIHRLHKLTTTYFSSLAAY